MRDVDNIKKPIHKLAKDRSRSVSFCFVELQHSIAENINCPLQLSNRQGGQICAMQSTSASIELRISTLAKCWCLCFAKGVFILQTSTVKSATPIIRSVFLFQFFWTISASFPLMHSKR